MGSALADAVARDGRAVLATIVQARGSTPRDAGTAMVVTQSGAIAGTIGGGRLEWEAIAAARRMLSLGATRPATLDRALGPDLGQCCGGFVRLSLEIVDTRSVGAVVARIEAAAEAAATQVLLFGAGHVGRALVIALAPLPVRVQWIDGRDHAFPPHIPRNTLISREPAETVLADAPAGSTALVMTHDHALDLAIVSAALSNPKIALVGLIGSATKRARFVRRLTEMGLASHLPRLACPLGLPGLVGKEPAVIAASIAADLLLRRAGRVETGATDGVVGLDRHDRAG